MTGLLCDVDPREGSHLRCHCASCRRALDLYGIPGSRTAGVTMFQTTPDRITFTHGQDRLGCMQLSPNGLLRWYATCCGTPMFNTHRSNHLPFVGVHTSCLSDTAALGPVIGYGYLPDDSGKERHRGLPRMIWRFFRRAAIARFTRRFHPSPFFDAEGAPVATPEPAPTAPASG